MALFSVIVTHCSGLASTGLRTPFLTEVPRRQAVPRSSCRARGSLASLRGRRAAAAGWGQEDEVSQSVPRPGGRAIALSGYSSESGGPSLPRNSGIKGRAYVGDAARPAALHHLRDSRHRPQWRVRVSQTCRNTLGAGAGFSHAAPTRAYLHGAGTGSALIQINRRLHLAGASAIGRCRPIDPARSDDGPGVPACRPNPGLIGVSFHVR